MTKAKRNSTARTKCDPIKKKTSPAITSSKETRDRKSSAPSTPTTRTLRAITRMSTPHKDGIRGRLASRDRSCQSTNKAKAGTKKPWEKLGSFHHCPTKRPRIEAYSQPTKPRSTTAFHHG